MSTEAEQNEAFIEWLKSGTGDFPEAVPLLGLAKQEQGVAKDLQLGAAQVVLAAAGTSFERYAVAYYYPHQQLLVLKQGVPTAASLAGVTITSLVAQVVACYASEVDQAWNDDTVRATDIYVDHIGVDPQANRLIDRTGQFAALARQQWEYWLIHGKVKPFTPTSKNEAVAQAFQPFAERLTSQPTWIAELGNGLTKVVPAEELKDIFQQISTAAKRNKAIAMVQDRLQQMALPSDILNTAARTLIKLATDGRTDPKAKLTFVFGKDKDDGTLQLPLSHIVTEPSTEVPTSALFHGEQFVPLIESPNDYDDAYMKYQSLIEDLSDTVFSEDSIRWVPKVDTNHDYLYFPFVRAIKADTQILYTRPDGVLDAWRQMLAKQN
jgi:hypothetical protein